NDPPAVYAARVRRDRGATPILRPPASWPPRTGRREDRRWSSYGFILYHIYGCDFLPSPTRIHAYNPRHLVTLAPIRSFAIAACLTLAYAQDASAWGPEGHRIVCRIAFQLLDTARPQEITRLTSKYRN